MDREKFINNFNNASAEINKEWLLEVLNNSIDSNLPDGNPRGHRNLIIVMEELAELTQEVSKQLRNKGDFYNTLQELADVQLGIYYVQELCKINNEDLQKAMNVKMKRLEDTLKENGFYK